MKNSEYLNCICIFRTRKKTVSGRVSAIPFPCFRNFVQILSQPLFVDAYCVTHLTAALSTDAWRVLTDAIRQQQALQVQRQQQHQQDQQQRQQLHKQQHQQQPAAPLADPPAPPAVPYTHIDHFNNREGVSFLHSAIHRSGAQSIAANPQKSSERNLGSSIL